MTAYKLLQKYLCLRKRLRRLKERVAVLEVVEPAFSPVQLFSAGEQGAWYDPSDLTTLFQDSAGTTPVTAAGQPVGRMLDKSGRGNHATQATSAARPTYQTSGGLHWLAFDGVDDFMATSTITPGVDKAQVFVGVKKLSDSVQILVETSSLITSNVGSLTIVQGTLIAAEYLAASRGSAIYTNAMLAQWVGNLSPDTAVLTSTHDIAGDLSVIRRNGVVGINSTVDQGTGNFLAYPLYIGARAGTSNFTIGNLYGMTVRFGANLSAGQITSSETYYAAKTGVVLP